MTNGRNENLEDADLFLSRLEWKNISVGSARLVGIYLLHDDEMQVVYVGQSTNIFGRIGAHIIERKLRFSSFTYALCDSKYLLALEKKLISKYQPKYNTGHLPRPVSLAIHAILELKKFRELDKDSEERLRKRLLAPLTDYEPPKEQSPAAQGITMDKL